MRIRLTWWDWLAGEMLTYGIKPEIEAFDLSHIFQAVKMAEDGRLKAPLYVQFVMGVKNAMPVDKDVFDFYVKTLNRLAPDAQWCGAGIAQNQIVLNEWCIAAGGACANRARRQCAPGPQHARTLQRCAGQTGR